MPGKLLSDADLESDAAMGKVETPRKQNEKVPPRAEGLGLGRTRGRGAGGEGAPAGSAARTRLVGRPAWVSAKGRLGVAFPVGGGHAAGVLAEAGTGRDCVERQVSHVVPEPGCPAPGALSWAVRSPGLAQAQT